VAEDKEEEVGEQEEDVKKDMEGTWARAWAWVRTW